MWTSPDLEMKGGYWHESMENFFLFYRVTYNAIKTVDEALQFCRLTFPFQMVFPGIRHFLTIAGLTNCTRTF